MSKLGADDFSGYGAKATEKMDPMPESSTFGKCTVVDSKCCIVSDTVPAGLGTGSKAMSPSLGVDLSIPGASGFDSMKGSTGAGGSSDPTTQDTRAFIK